MTTYKNPILSGFYPDPSICRVGKDYYLVTSTFTYFPGVPIFHSKDLVNWHQIGNVLDRPSQLPLSKGEHSHGIFAPTLRYYQGIFYLITTNVSNGGNFIVTADNPEGPWSDPFWLDTDGIDPSLFFDEDGRCWYSGTRERSEGATFWGDNEIYIQEVNLEEMTMVGPSYVAWHGALRGAKWAEGPHIYKKNGWYYLLISEGGTGHEHALTIARSRSLGEKFIGHESNPILTHRNLGKNYPIVNVGHGDLVESQTGQWWMVLLASRPYGGYYRNLGRETFLVAVVWEDGWPLVCPGTGVVPIEAVRPNLPMDSTVDSCHSVDFDCHELPLELLHIRNPNPSHYSLTQIEKCLTMTMSNNHLNGDRNPTGVFLRQRSKSFVTETRMFSNLKAGDRAGMCLFQSNHYYYTLEDRLQEENSSIAVIRCIEGKEEVMATVPMELGKTWVDFKIIAEEQKLHFYAKRAGDRNFLEVANSLDGRILSTDVAGGFVGTVIGLYATTKAQGVTRKVSFRWLKQVDIELDIEVDD